MQKLDCSTEVTATIKQENLPMKQETSFGKLNIRLREMQKKRVIIKKRVK